MAPEVSWDSTVNNLVKPSSLSGMLYISKHHILSRRFPEKKPLAIGKHLVQAWAFCVSLPVPNW